MSFLKVGTISNLSTEIFFDRLKIIKKKRKQQKRMLKSLEVLENVMQFKDAEKEDRTRKTCFSFN